MLKNKILFLIKVATKLAYNKKEVVYIAGKVTGLPPGEVKAKFKAAQQKMEGYGYLVLNPCEFITPTESWDTAMRMALTLLSMADIAYFLPDWKDSAGATIECDLATRVLGINVIFE